MEAEQLSAAQHEAERRDIRQIISLWQRMIRVMVGPPDCRPFIKPLAGIIKQACPATPHLTPAERVHRLEMDHFNGIVDRLTSYDCVCFA